MSIGVDGYVRESDNLQSEMRGMRVGELIHTMLVEFDSNKIGDSECDGAFLQNERYYWAADRLNELFDKRDGL